MGAIGVDVCHRLPVRKEIDEAFFKQLEEASHLQGQVLLADLNHPSICWRGNTTGCKQSRKLLECVYDSFLAQAIGELTTKGAQLDLTVPVLVLAGMGLTFFTGAHIVLCFRSVTKTMLIVNQCFSYCLTMFVENQGLLCFLLCFLPLPCE